jgi:hypothetical protein
MANFYLIGHGGWDRMSGRAFVTVPANTSISFYTEIGEILTVGEAIAVLQGGGAANRFCEATRSAPNQLLGPLYQEGEGEGRYYTSFRVAALGVLARGDRYIWVDKLTHLKEFFDDYPGYDFHWLACSEVV